jgi:hypothetical protein
MKRVIALAVAFTAPALSPTPAQTPIEIGVAHEVQSNSLKERRKVNVVLPPSYANEPDRRYPVLYLVDGGVAQDLLHVAGVVQLGALWGRSAEAIVVGIETRDRRRELVGPTRDSELLKRYPTAGGSMAFRAFIRSDVKPLIERNYRTDGRGALLGESLAGLFVLETYLEEPELFDGYGAIDPSLWWDKEALSLSAAPRLGARQQGQSLFLAFAREQLENPSANQRFVAAVRAQGLPLCEIRRPDLTHATVYQQLIPQGVQHLLPPAKPASVDFGFVVPCNEDRFTSVKNGSEELRPRSNR